MKKREGEGWRSICSRSNSPRNIVDAQVVSSTVAAFASPLFQPSALPTDPESCVFCPFKCLKRHQLNQSKGVIGVVKNLKVGAGKPGELDLVPEAPKEEL